MPDTILIVDDEPSQRRMAEYAISEKLKYHTLSASGGKEAIDWVLEGRLPMPDLMLLDMRMPQVDGLQVIRAIKPQRPDFPIIILTDYGDHENATLAIHAGANDFLTRPVAVERLGLSIANALRVRHLHQTIARLEKNLAADGVRLPDAPLSIAHTPALMDEQGKLKKLRTLEEEAIRFALRSCGGSMTRAARSLGIGRSTLYRKVSELERYNKPADQRLEMRV